MKKKKKMMMMLIGETAATTTFFIILVIILLLLHNGVHAQTNQTQSTTDPTELSNLKSIYAKWSQTTGLGEWNISSDPCRGASIDANVPMDTPAYNPFVKCDCSYNNGSTCHINQLKVFALSVTGPIPDEIWTLTYLFNLDLRQNVLTGSLSPSISNLTRLQYLSVGANELSGEVPKELGLLTGLISLSLATNNFSGPLPSELGSLRKLEKLYLSSCGASGPIPSSFANLTTLMEVMASDVAFTGRIPDFIGNWSKLTTLVLEGNSFQGSIPSTFSALTSLQNLKISDLVNGSSSSLAFIKNMKKLSVLVLRNDNISDSIPSDIGEYKSLIQLDLSFNNLVGEIPADSLFSLSLLTYLFLGNNYLSGTLPELKSESLVNIDVSFNNLTGSLPSWISEPNLQINPIGNSFTIGSDTDSVLPFGLNCLQRNFDCNRGSPIYSRFAIKCGGQEMTSSDNIVFERDNSSLGAATYYVTDTKRWAVSSTGYFSSSSDPQYIFTSAAQFTNTLDSDLFQTSRVSPSSLKYYGLGLENGNYTATLYFAEPAIQNTGWYSVGQRVFDIYIQGNLVEKDFDIKKQAGGFSLRAVEKEYKGVVVVENYLEIHLFWSGKGTTGVPTQATYGLIISAISAVSDFTPSVSNKPAIANKKNHSGMIIGIVGALSLIGIVVLISVLVWRKRSVRRRRMNEEDMMLGTGVRPYTFSYAELKAATDDFNLANKLGEGGFGPVFKGTLNDGRVVAVKRLSVTSHQGKDQFIAEIGIISAVQHRNLVKLYGCCIEGNQQLVVYEYLENKSLAQALFAGQTLRLELDWKTRYNICLGVARGLCYLHEESRLRIVHRDVKAGNILLDSDLTPKISDFGLAKLYDASKTHISTRVAGTIGYLSPEYAMRGHLTEKVDVFAYGIVLLEVVSGRPNSDSTAQKDKVYLLEWAWNAYEAEREVDLLDSSLTGEYYDEGEVKLVVGLALLCTQTSPSLRPSMSRVVTMLTGDVQLTPVTTRPAYFTDWNFTDDESSLLSSQTNIGGGGGGGGGGSPPTTFLGTEEKTTSTSSDVSSARFSVK